MSIHPGHLREYVIRPVLRSLDLYNYLSYRPGLARLVAEYGHTANQLAGSLNYATAMARIHYLRVPAPLPSPGDVDGLANYWKTYFNTSAGAGRPETAVRHYQSLALID